MYFIGACKVENSENYNIRIQIDNLVICIQIKIFIEYIKIFTLSQRYAYTEIKPHTFTETYKQYLKRKSKMLLTHK